MNSIHQFKVSAIAGGDIDLAAFKGKKILIVNVASVCGYTPQYAQLQELWEAYQAQLVILACPSNDFGGQELGSDEEILAFCDTHYGITFPIAAKMKVGGALAHPLYQWLRQEDGGQAVQWNFHKYLLDQGGRLLYSLPPSASPFDDRILDALAPR